MQRNWVWIFSHSCFKTHYVVPQGNLRFQSISVWLTYSPAGEGKTSLVLLVRIDHAQIWGNLPVRVGNDGIREIIVLAVCLQKKRRGEGTMTSHTCLLATIARLDVFDPAFVWFDGVTRQGNNLGLPLGKFWHQLGYLSQLSGAHRGEISRVGEKNAPTVHSIGMSWANNHAS